jgi:hypothetical protein
MNRKAQLISVGAIIIVFMSIIIGLALLSGSFANIGNVINTNTVVNSSQTFPVAGANLTLTGQAASSMTIINRTSGVVVPATNYTINNYNIDTTGSLYSYITGNPGTYGGNTVNVSYTYEPLGYAKESSNRTIVGLIAIFAALAIAVVALVPGIREAVGLSR